MDKHPHFLWADLFRRRRRTSDLVRILGENILFATLKRRELGYLSSFVYERVFEPGEPIFRQGDRGVGMYLIRTQAVESAVFVTELGEGSFLGELALVDPQHLRSAHAVAIERSVLIGFFKPDLQEILDRNPAMGVKILFQLSSVLGRRLLETTDKITQMRSSHAKAA